MIFASTNKKKKVLRKYTELLDKIENQIETINCGESIKYTKDFMKIRFESNDDLPLGKILTIPCMITVVKSVFEQTANIIHKFIYMNVGINL